MANQTTHLGFTDFRNERKKFGILPKDRLRHMYVIGKTGTGKSTFLEQIALQDILNGEGFTFLDPHGKTADLLLEYIPESRKKDVVYFAPFDTDYPISFNVMEDVEPDRRSLVANGLLSTFKKIYPDAFSGRMEYIFANTILALLETPESTLLGINRMYSDKEFRKGVIDNIKDPSVKSFWADEFMNWEPKYQKEATASIVNKVGQFTANPIIRNMMGQPKSSFDIRDLMDQGKIIIANLSKGRLGDENSRLIGGMLVSKLYLAAMSRAQMTEDEIDNLPSHYLYADEFQNFANDSFAQILAEARKYKLGLIVAHQYVSQMPETVRDAIFGNVGTMVIFRIGEMDAEPFAREFSPTFVEEDFTNLAFGQYYMKLSINGVSSRPFSAAALGPLPSAAGSIMGDIIKASQEQFAVPRAEVESAIATWFEPIPDKKAIEYQAYLEQKKADILAKGGSWMDGDEYKVRKEIGALPDSHQKSDKPGYQNREGGGGYQGNNPKPGYPPREGAGYDKKPYGSNAGGSYQKPYEKPASPTARPFTPKEEAAPKEAFKKQDVAKKEPEKTTQSLKELFAAIKIPETNQEVLETPLAQNITSVTKAEKIENNIVEGNESMPETSLIDLSSVGNVVTLKDGNVTEKAVISSDVEAKDSPVMPPKLIDNTKHIHNGKDNKKYERNDDRKLDLKREHSNKGYEVKPVINNNTKTISRETKGLSLRDLLEKLKVEPGHTDGVKQESSVVRNNNTESVSRLHTEPVSDTASEKMRKQENRPILTLDHLVPMRAHSLPLIEQQMVNNISARKDNETDEIKKTPSESVAEKFDIEEYLKNLSVPIKTDTNVKREIPEDVLRNLFEAE